MSKLQNNITNLQNLLEQVNALPEAGGGEQATPVISVNTSGLITATAGSKTSTHQLAFQAAKTITPSTASQIAVSSGYYTGGNVMVAGDSNLVAENIVSGKSIFGVAGTATIGNDPFAALSFTYTVNDISGAQYGFIKNSNGYYESQNKGQKNSYAICRVNLTVTSTCDITFDVINYAESNYDYAVFGNLDSALELSYYADSSAKKTFKGQQSASVVKVTYSGVTSGNHYIDIKFIKDSSQDQNNDSVQFKLPEPGALSQETIDKILAADTDLVAENIKSGINIFGVNGTYAGSGGGDTSVEDSIITKTISSYTNDRATTIGDYAFAYCSILTTVSFPVATSIGSSAFWECRSLTTASFPVATSIGDNAFWECRNLTTASFPVATYIGSSAFRYCRNLTTVSFPAATFIGSHAFSNCYSLTTVNFPAVTSIGSNAFATCSNLTTASFPIATYIGGGAFTECSNLTTASFPAVTSLYSYAFSRCYNLTTASFPAATSIGSSAFGNCYSLTTVNFPAATIIGINAFADCISLTTVDFPAATAIYNYAFSSCFSLTTVSFPAATIIYSSVFRYCYNLKSLYLTGSSVCQLSNSNTFYSTPIGGYSASAGTYGSIYVPASLLTSYQTATNWTYFSRRFVGI